MILSRGSVALRPAFLRSCGVVMGGRFLRDGTGGIREAAGSGTRPPGAAGPMADDPEGSPVGRVYNSGSFRKRPDSCHDFPAPAGFLSPSPRDSGSRCRSSPRSPRAAARRSTPTSPTSQQFGVYKLDINQGNYPVAGHGRQAQGRPDPRAGPRPPRHAARHQRVPRRPLGLRVPVHPPGHGPRAAPLHRLLRRRQARAVGGRRDAAVAVELNRSPPSGRSAGCRRPTTRASSTWFFDLFRNDRDDDGSRSPAPAAAWARR